MAQEITNLDEVLDNNKIVVVDFWAEWCGPCRTLAPIIDNVAASYDGQAMIGKINVDENHDAAMKYGVRNIPTVIFFKEGKLAGKIVGLHPQAEYAAKIDALL